MPKKKNKKRKERYEQLCSINFEITISDCHHTISISYPHWPAYLSFDQIKITKIKNNINKLLKNLTNMKICN